MREDKHAKARRYLATGKVRLISVGTNTIARIDGDTGIWTVTGTKELPPICNCPAGERHVLCCHILATELVAS